MSSDKLCHCGKPDLNEQHGLTEPCRLSEQAEHLRYYKGCVIYGPSSCWACMCVSIMTHWQS